jgi:mannose-6-phosphate isomerase-like protein (cupin superfamily)
MRRVIELGHPYTDPNTGAAITVLRNDADLFEFELRYPPGRGRLRPHVHLDMDQEFDILEGRVAAEVAGGKRSLAAGEHLAIPKGVPHRDPWNPGSETAVVRNRVRPNPPFVPIYTETVLARMVTGKLPASGDISPLQIAVIAQDTGGQSYLARPGVGLQRRMLPVMAAIGRRLGYGAETLPPLS